jgi:hypothetical protein
MGSLVAYHLIEEGCGRNVHKLGITAAAVTCHLTAILLLLDVTYHTQAVIAVLHCGQEHLQVKHFPLL